MPKTTKQPKPLLIDNLTDDELLRIRVKDLGLAIEGSVLEERIARLYSELDHRGISFHPSCYLADEWLTPDGYPTIGIPFFLAHPRLTSLEKKMMLEAEGETDTWCMRLLRHEAGHALNYAYKLHRRTRWRELFGPYSTPYTSGYSAKPYSKRFVNHLEDNYAQAHPDEDFAETFAVWLTPNSCWEERYRGWPAIKKLRYVDHVFKSLGSKPPLVSSQATFWSASRMRSTLGAFYERKRRLLGDDFPGFYDPGLTGLFSDYPGETFKFKASRFFRSRRRLIVDAVSRWTGQRKFDVDKLVRQLASRSDGLGLYLKNSETDTIYDVVAFVTAAMAKVRQFRGGDNK